MLGRSVFRRIQNRPGKSNSVPGTRELLYEFFQYPSMLPNRQALHIFEDKVGGFQLGYDAYEVSYKAIAWIVQRPMPDHGEALTGRATKHNIHTLTAYPCTTPDLVSGQTGNRPWQHGALREVVLVNCTMDRVDFNSGDNIETCLLKPQSQASGPCK
jgi:hypothetical protein